MRYLILIYEDESFAPPTEEEMRRWFALSEEMAQAGVLVEAHELQRTDTATTLRMRGGKLLTTDGPFAETKEALGGFYLVECRDLDEALGWARRMPNLERGTIEVRPVVEERAE